MADIIQLLRATNPETRALVEAAEKVESIFRTLPNDQQTALAAWAMQNADAGVWSRPMRAPVDSAEKPWTIADHVLQVFGDQQRAIIEVRATIAKRANCSITSIDSTVGKLVRKGLMDRVQPGVYKVTPKGNPNLNGHGPRAHQEQAASPS